MKISEIQELIKFVAKSGASEVEIQNKDFKLVIKTPASGKNVAPQAVVMQAAPAAVVSEVAAPPVVTAPTVAEKAAEKKKQDAATAEAKLVTIKSPMIGTFYRSPSPDKPVFVNVGDEVKPGNPICIIEAMKLFNEIESDITGRIVKVLVDDATPVEYDQPLFLVEPN